ncbi:phage portal protein [Nocardia cyriacigeorgica]|uniref:Phage portal protein n=1 Tax=Nocardia cyriacigeorgica TaxID=135487 RepID=A0A6P1CPS9_9NOCA|nr:phage portal protein [Nocardia cyriacigeorgica]NEW33832.1 phage portal protein [Nocardia cyriacigeorgica]
MNREQAVDAAREMLQGPRWYESQRLELLAAAMQPWTAQSALDALEIRGVTSTQMQGALSALVGLARKSQTNFLPLILDVFGQALKVENYLAGGEIDPVTGRRTNRESASPWQWWQRNQFGAKQTGINRGALHYGVSYATVLPSLTADPDDPPAVHLRGVSARQMTALYGEPLEWDPRRGGPVDDAWPIMAMEMKGPMIRVYDERAVHFIGVKQVPQSALGWRDPAYLSVNNFEYIEGRNHDVGVCPVVRFQDRILLDGEEQFGIIEPLLTIQERINETTYEMLVAQYWSAFRQRYVMGWLPKSQEDAMRHAASDTWYFRDPQVKAGQFDATDLENYTKSKESGLRDMSAIGQIPAQQLGLTGISNISEATLAALEAGKDRKVSEIETSLGESYEQLLRTAAHIAGDTVAASDFASEVVWADATARSFAQTVDGLGKLSQLLGVPEEILWEDIPGWTREKVLRARSARDDADERDTMTIPVGAE